MLMRVSAMPDAPVACGVSILQRSEERYSDPMNGVPTIPLAGLAGELAARQAVAAQIGAACRAHGFFYVTEHGVDLALCRQLEALSREFFAQPLAEKMRIAMARGGHAWRGYFPPGAELTSGRPDHKEGLYLGIELPPDHPKVRKRVPLHGPNLFPDIAGFRETVLAYIDAVSALGQRLMSAIALSLGLPEDQFAQGITADPLVLFRIFNYPAPRDGEDDKRAAGWGVGEHTDYGLLTMLLQDEHGGLQVKTPAGWIEAPPMPGSFICNIGDMLDRMTGGLYRSTPHRVRASTQHDRLSFPLFFDPGFDTRPQRIAGLGDQAVDDDRETRWDRASVHAFEGTYGEYLLAKVSKVFPQLREDVL